MGCVYLAINRLNGKSYIGKTIFDLTKRSREHFNDSSKGSNFHFHKAIRKYGIDNFLWVTLYESDDEEDLFSHERLFIASMKTVAPNGYNMTLGGDGTCGHRHTEETITLLSKIHTGMKHSDETKLKIKATRYRKPVICIQTGVEYESAVHASVETGLSSTGIAGVCRGERSTCGGFEWVFKGSDYKPKKNETCNKIINNETGEIYRSINSASKKTGESWDIIKKSCLANGKWSYYEH